MQKEEESRALPYKVSYSIKLKNKELLFFILNSIVVEILFESILASEKSVS